MSDPQPVTPRAPATVELYSVAPQLPILWWLWLSHGIASVLSVSATIVDLSSLAPLDTAITALTRAGGLATAAMLAWLTLRVSRIETARPVPLALRLAWRSFVVLVAAQLIGLAVDEATPNYDASWLWGWLGNATMLARFVGEIAGAALVGWSLILLVRARGKSAGLGRLAVGVAALGIVDGAIAFRELGGEVSQTVALGITALALVGQVAYLLFLGGARWALELTRSDGTTSLAAGIDGEPPPGRQRSADGLRRYGRAMLCKVAIVVGGCVVLIVQAAISDRSPATIDAILLAVASLGTTVWALAGLARFASISDGTPGDGRAAATLLFATVIGALDVDAAIGVVDAIRNPSTGVTRIAIDELVACVLVPVAVLVLAGAILRIGRALGASDVMRLARRVRWSLGACAVIAALSIAHRFATNDGVSGVIEGVAVLATGVSTTVLYLLMIRAASRALRR